MENILKSNRKLKSKRHKKVYQEDCAHRMLFKPIRVRKKKEMQEESI